MKICQLCAIDWTMARLLLPLCVAMREAGHEVVAVCSDGPMLERVAAAGIRCRPAAIARSAHPLKALASSRAVARIMREEAFDMVHVHTPVASLVGRLAAWRCGVPLIAYTAHGFYFHERMAWAPRLAFVALEWLAGRITHVLMTENREDAAFARTWGLVRGGGQDRGYRQRRRSHPLRPRHAAASGCPARRPGHAARRGGDRRCRPPGRREGLSRTLARHGKGRCPSLGRGFQAR